MRQGGCLGVREWAIRKWGVRWFEASERSKKKSKIEGTRGKILFV